MFQSLLNRINFENRLTVSIVGGFSIAFAIFLTIYIIILPSDKNFDTAKDSSLVDFVRLRKNDFLNERERALPEKPPPPKKPPGPPPEPENGPIPPGIPLFLLLLNRDDTTDNINTK